MKPFKSLFIIMCVATVLLSCSDSGKFLFQRNDPEPEYRLFDLLDPYPALYDAFDTVDQHRFNVMLSDAINADVTGTKNALQQMPAINPDPLVDIVAALRIIIERIINQDNYRWRSDPYDYDNYITDFYSFLDDLDAASPGTTNELVSILRKSIGYIQYAHGHEIETVMADLIDFLKDTQGQNVGTVLPLLQEGLGKTLLRANTFYDDSSNKLGNAVVGMDALLSGINDIATEDVDAREALYDVIRELGAVMTAKVGDKTFADILKELMINIEDYATVGGSVYNSDASYYHDGSDYYVNTELKNGVRQMLPGLALLFIRAGDNEQASPIYDPVDNNSPNPDGRSALEYLTQKLYDLKLNCGIDFANYEVEPSLKRMTEYNGFGELRSSASYKVSYLDHLVYTLIASYDFGFLTKTSDGASEPYNNDQDGHCSVRKHGEPTAGIITINDSLYSMVSHAKEARSSSQNCTIGWLGAYNLALDARAVSQTWNGDTGGLLTSVEITNGAQGNYIYRYKNSFLSSQANNYKFYLGYDFPTLLLFSGFSAGDAGIPNGGITGIVPTSNTTTVGTNNDYRTYYPYIGNGLGELNTGRWTMGWIARACWEGEGPYYYADPNAETRMASDGRIYHVYFRPDGRIYAFVCKEDPANPLYFYPSDGGNDADDLSGQQLVTSKGTFTLRDNRYRAEWQSDRIMFKSEYAGNQGQTRYYTLGRVVGNTGADRYLLRKINTPDNNGDDVDAGLLKPNNLTASGLIFKEKIAEKSPLRECNSQEEAIYRNFQWLMLEKKIVFIMPMRSYVHVKPTIISDDCADLVGGLLGEVDLEPFVITVLEANGIYGMRNLKKGLHNGYWNELGSEGSGGCTGHDKDGNIVEYGDSNIPGDGRVFAIVREDAGYLNIPILGKKGDYVDVNTIWDTILGNGSATPAILGDNLAPIARMAFLQPDLVASNSSDIGNINAVAWQNRNKLLPIIVALSGDLHEKSYYDKPSNQNDHWYNFSGNHKYPLKYLRDLIAMLGNPIMRYYKTPYVGATKGWVVPQIQDQHGRGVYAMFTPKPIDSAVNFNPNSSLRSVAAVLTENSQAAADGVIPALANSKMVTKLMALLQKIGQYGYGALPIYQDGTKESSDYADWGARRKIFYGLEQIVTRMKCNKSIEQTRNYYGISYPEWMFVKNSDDIDMDVALDELIGYDDVGGNPYVWGKGLAAFVDHRDSAHPNYQGWNWNNYYKLVNGLGELMSNQGATNGYYCINDDLIEMIDKTLTSFKATNAQLKGVRHTLGTVLYYYDDDTSQWIIPNELNDILTGYLPQILQEYTGYNADLLSVASNMLMDDGFVEYFMSNLSSPHPSEDVFNQLYEFLNLDLIKSKDSRLWDDLNELMIGLVVRLNETLEGSSYKAASFEDYTKPVYLSPSEYLYNDEFDPYSGLGQLLTK